MNADILAEKEAPQLELAVQKSTKQLGMQGYKKSVS